MTRDTLDELLDHSAPPSRPAAKHDLDAMIAEARQSAPRTARSRVIVAAGLAAAFTFGGVGIAAATDGLTWAPWAQHPIGAVRFTMDNGLPCELRFSEYTQGRDASFIREVNGILEHWYRSTDVLPIVQAIVPSRLAGLDPEDLESGIGQADEVLPPGEAERREWSRQWSAWELAVSDAESHELAAHGIRPDDERFAGAERSGQIQCRDQDGEPYAPGAGS